MAYSNFTSKNSFQKFRAYIYTFWCIICFILIFVSLFPLYYIFLQKEKWKPKAHYLNRVWAKTLFFLIGIRSEIQYNFVPATKGTYVFVTNHFSYWDIAVLGTFIDNYFAFVGKSSVKKIPLIGYMFSKLHIQVDRSEKESRAKSMTRAMRALEKGRSMMMFAEGGILTRNPPQMVKPFKDGAFLMAIQHQLPIVPITLLNSYQIIWDEDLLMSRLPIRAIVHEPISTKGMKTSNMDELKEKTWNIIQKELDRYHGINQNSGFEKISKI